MCNYALWGVQTQEKISKGSGTIEDRYENKESYTRMHYQLVTNTDNCLLSPGTVYFWTISVGSERRRDFLKVLDLYWP